MNPCIGQLHALNSVLTRVSAWVRSSLEAFSLAASLPATVRSASPECDASLPPSLMASNISYAEASSRELTGRTGSFGYMVREMRGHGRRRGLILESGQSGRRWGPRVMLCQIRVGMHSRA